MRIGNGSLNKDSLDPPPTHIQNNVISIKKKNKKNFPWSLRFVGIYLHWWFHRCFLVACQMTVHFLLNVWSEDYQKCYKYLQLNGYIIIICSLHVHYEKRSCLYRLIHNLLNTCHMIENSSLFSHDWKFLSIRQYGHVWALEPSSSWYFRY